MMKTNLLAKSLTVLIFSTLFTISSCKQEDLYSSKEKDEKELSSLRAEIQKMSEQVSCNNASDWKIVPIGAKACGGADGFVAYSINIDTSLFLQKVADYNNKRKAFNVKWSIGSDCSIIVGPKSITCDNGKPKLVY